MAKKATKKKASQRKATASKPSAPKQTLKKKVSKAPAKAKAPAKKAAPKKAAPKKAPAKKPTKKAAAKKAVKKAPAKKAPVKKAAAKKAVAKKVVAKKAPVAKAGAKKPGAKAPAKKASAKKAPTKAAASKTAQKANDPKSGRQGITIVARKRMKRVKAKQPRPMVPALSGSFLGMGRGGGRPLIPSGPKAPPVGGTQVEGVVDSGKKPKSPFTKRQLDKYRDILIQKRRELLGDIDSMEHEALKSQSGSDSHLPQHMAEQGSETYEQSLSLDLAAADRVLLREIDAAMERIANRTFGLCEHTGKPISTERLAELPWARYSIEAAREMERRAN